VDAALAVTSAAAVAERLRELGVDLPVPDPGTARSEGTPKIPPALWQNVMIPRGSSPRAEPVFFIEYAENFRATLAARDPEFVRKFEAERKLPHPNGAMALATDWLAVAELEVAAVRYEKLGFRRVRDFRFDQLQARAIELELGHGSLLLLESTSPQGPIGKLLDLRGFGIEVPGVSIEVQSVDDAIASMPREVSAQLKISSGRWGRNVVIPPELAHGVWIELFEKGPASN
jgi:hypothetical protein